MYPLLQSVLAGTITSSNPVQNSIITSKGAMILGSKDNSVPKSNEEQYVAIVPIKSTIYKYNQECGPRGTKTIMSHVKMYLNDPQCAGIVLDIDSGGGQVSGTPEFHDFIKESNERKPIHAYSDGYMCSAAYYIGSAAAEITVNKRADVIGSIGTMVSFIDFTGYYEKKGAKIVTEYATKSTNKNKAWKELLAGNPETYIKTELDPITDTFIDDIKAVRSSIDESVFDGSTYNPEKALEMGLIDKIGSLQSVVDSIFSKSKSNKNNTMSKSTTHVALMGVLAVDSLEMNDKGAYFNEDQLTSVEASLNDKQAEIDALTASEATAKAAQVTAETALEAANNATETTVDNLLASIGQNAEGTIEEKVATLTTKVTELAKKPGTAHATPRGTNEPKNENSFVDPNASHNQMADNLLNQ